jgi:hypothetical protein
MWAKVEALQLLGGHAPGGAGDGDLSGSLAIGVASTTATRL